MKTLLFFILVFLLFFYCGTDVEFKTAEMQQVLTDVLTLELTFGAEERVLKDEFLLARPIGIAANDQNDILVVDENYVKVYDSSGKEKTMFGGTGQGPGEFNSPFNAIIAPSGYLTILDGKSINIYSPEHKFVTRKNLTRNVLLKMFLEENNFAYYFIIKAIANDEKESVIQLLPQELQSEELNIWFDVLIYDSPDTVIDIASYRSQAVFILSTTLEFKGDLFFEMLPANRVVFTHSLYDSNDKESIYTMHVMSLKTFKKFDISYNYLPVEIPEEVKKPYLGLGKGQSYNRDGTPVSTPPSIKRIFEAIKKTAKETKYYPAVKNIMADGNIIFVFTYLQNEKEEYFTDIIDLESGKYLNSAYFAFIPQVIKNGYAYKFNDWLQNNEFALVEKYKIDPAVYGK